MSPSITYLLLFAAAGCCCALAADPAPPEGTAHQEQAHAAKARIVPVVVVKQGEQKELLLSTSCTVGSTRGGGLDVREIGGKERPDLKSEKVWKRDGVEVEVPDFDPGEKQASKPEYESLRKAGINVFSVKVTAAKDAKPGTYDLHLADFTCNGTCETDFRVLILPGK